MSAMFLHKHDAFEDLLKILEEDLGIAISLIEKDYWIMHCLYGLKKQGYEFQLKGGTSLSKGYHIIDRFSEDIDIHINPPKELGINENPNNSNVKNVQKKKEYYDRLATEINIPGITDVIRDVEFDDPNKYNSGGIRLYYKQVGQNIEGIKQGILLEAGYDNTAPNAPVTISSWAYERAKDTTGIDIIDNRAVDILCYDPRYTFVEKLQTIATKFRKERNTGKVSTNYMRQYYDVYSLLGIDSVVAFLGTQEYLAHKEKRFPKEDFEIPINQNEAFLLRDASTRKDFQKRYESTKALYYKGQPDFDELLKRIQQHLDKL